MSVLSSLFKRLLKGRGDDIAEKVAQNYGDDAIRIATNGIKNHLDEGLALLERLCPRLCFV